MDKIIRNITNILKDLTIFFPSKTNNMEENKNAIIKFCIYISIIIGIFTKNYFMIVFLIVLLIMTEIFGNILIKNKNKIEPFKCRKTTIDNPMGNLLLYTKEDEFNESLCKYQDKKIDNNIKYNIYHNSSDLFLKKNNTRSFITMPSQTNPNNIDNYKKYLYYFDNPTCKTNQLNCMFNEDLRYHKTYFLKKN